MKKTIVFLSIFLILNLMLCFLEAKADTLRMPQWYKMTASLSNPPELNRVSTLKVELSAIIGNLENIRLRLIMPESWKSNSEKSEWKKIEAGQSKEFDFEITPKTMLSQGSIVVEAVFNIPKASIGLAIDKMTTDKSQSASLKSDLDSWPNPTKRYTDVSFAMFPEESFYPISCDMWVNYADEMAPTKDFKGPSYFRNSMLSIYQAQTDVEMFNKLKELLKTDDSLYEKLTKSGIDIDKKRLDYLNGLYALGLESWQNNDYQTALDLLDQLENGAKSVKSGMAENLRIASANIKALVFWKQGQRRLAEEAFQKAFYQNRKHSLQRYILRNLGLLMFVSGDKVTAQHMYGLAKGFKSGYSLLEREEKVLSAKKQ